MVLWCYTRITITRYLLLMLFLPCLRHLQSDPAKPGVSSYAFLWSIPNAIPLNPDQILQIWKTLKFFNFDSTYGVFAKSSNIKQNPTIA